MQIPDMFAAFSQEAEELLGRIEEIALELETRPDLGLVNELFRAFHTIKGSGAMFGFDAVAEFTHHVETVLDQVRGGSLPVSAELVALVLRARDQIGSLMASVRGGTVPDTVAGDAIVAELAALNGESKAGAAPVAVLRRWLIRFRPHPGIMACGTNVALLFAELREMGECAVKAIADGVPALEDLDPEQCFLRWEVELTTERDANAIRDVFIFAEDGAELTIEAVSGESAAVGVESLALPVRAAETAPEPQTAVRAGAARDSVVRVPSEKLDRLVNLVGELVMNQSRLAQAALRVDAPELAAPVEEIERLVAELRDDVLSIRMMPIGSTFGRFRRLVHDVSAELGKDIELVTEGAETELDKSVLDQLGDPLVHLIRNSVDHGIEAPEVREQAGKPRRGTVTLSAIHTGSSVIVRIEDDGKGLDPARLRERAVEKRLIAADAELTEKEAFQLIFLPGFSTARQVTNLSGRGVGMDVVKRSIEALRGTVAVSSQTGRGTAISLTLPLTLAIIDGLLVAIGEDQFIIPMSAVTENVELHRSERQRHNGRNLFAVRGESISYIRLRETFGIRGGEQDIEKIVIVRHEDHRVGLVVDRVLGSHQTVIQSLGRFYKDIGLVSGATIMGDGSVALILSVSGLVSYADEQCATLRTMPPPAQISVSNEVHL